ncbi:MAG: leucine-rich repeat domain-containing protein [Muribaculaceae bacterium]|nr:leucine-rich repeat domain-containing protein [Muribaculaceae bacterium]MDE6753775.1 leucine-rich repeat domain-containing protein [Muribaculaceae bacterium]
MLRKIFTFCALLALSFSANAIIWHCDHFNTSKMTCRIKGWGGNQPSSGKLKIPETFTNEDGKTYTVTAVAANALNNLNEVTEIFIPATLVAIGEAKLSEAGTGNVMLDNFIGCSSLVKFVVEGNHKFFITDSNGALYDNDYYNLYKVPAKMETASGKYVIDDRCRNINENAFADNKTIKSLYLPSDVDIWKNGGLNKAVNIASYHINTVGSIQDLYLDNGCLIHKKGSYEGKPSLVSCPPRTSLTGYKVPSAVFEIGPYAFANTKNLIAVDLGSVEELNSKILYHSSIEHVTIPKTVRYSVEGALSSSTHLREITILADKFVCKEDFARNCPELTAVTSKYPIKRIDSRAFMNCPSLTDFPFDAGTDWHGDSILYNSGIKKAVFKGKTSDDFYGNGDYLFVNCDNLTTIDMSGVDTSKSYMSIGRGFAKNCPNLTTFISSDFTWFNAAGSDTGASFMWDNLEEIHLGTFFNVTYSPMFRYRPIGDKKEFTPHVYIALTRNMDRSKKKYASMPLRNLFEVQGGAKLVPNYYCDLFDPKVYYYGDDFYDPSIDNSGNGSEEYIASRGIYYVPGGCAGNYDEVKKSGRQVKEMFKLSVSKEGSRMFVKTWTGECDVTNLKLIVNDGYEVSMKLKEEYDMPVAYKDVKSLLLTYKVNGVKMSTSYPPSFWDNGGVGVNGNEFTGAADLENDVALPYVIYNLSGTTVASGNGTPSTLNLEKGMYILRQGNKTEKIIVGD